MLEMRERYSWASPSGVSDGSAIVANERMQGGEYAAGLPLQDEPHLMLVCKSNLERECIFNGLMMNGLKLPVVSFASVDRNMPLNGAIVVLMHIGSKRLADPFFSDEVEAAIKAGSDPVGIAGRAGGVVAGFARDGDRCAWLYSNISRYQDLR